jgi:RND family efflux transporter MFP subunit
VAFEEGAYVAEGDLLFVIDKRPFEAARDRAEAELARAQAAADNAEAERRRGETLLARGTISQEEYDRRLSAKREADAAVVAARAGLRAAELDLEFTEIRAPIAGRISDKRVTVGNLVNGGPAGSTLLTNIVTDDPMYFSYTASEAAYLKYQRLDMQGRRDNGAGGKHEVWVKLSDEDEFTRKGVIDFVDNQLDPSTGTMRGRAVFANDDGLLAPGLFGRLRVPGSKPYEAVLIPDGAVVADQARRLVYVVGDEAIAQPRPIELGPLVDGLRVVRAGLEPSERFVAAGVVRVRPGAPITPIPARVEADGSVTELAGPNAPQDGAGGGDERT